MEKIEEISIDLTKHDIEIKSYAGSYATLKIDDIDFNDLVGKEIDGHQMDNLKRIAFVAPYINNGDDFPDKKLSLVIKHINRKRGYKSEK